MPLIVCVASFLCTSCDKQSGKISKELDSLININPKVIELRKSLAENAAKQNVLQLDRELIRENIMSFKLNKSESHAQIKRLEQTRNKQNFLQLEADKFENSLDSTINTIKFNKELEQTKEQFPYLRCQP